MAKPASNEICFRLNDRLVHLDKVSATRTLLDYLRLEQKLTGSKEGCAEGDCGACTVLIGRLSGDELIYETVTACIRLVGSLHGCHVVTIEYLTHKNGALHPVQQAMVNHHGSQCGFCTPGIVMSLYALWLENPDPSRKQIETSLQGNLCRCTGYTPIMTAADMMSEYGLPENDLLKVERSKIIRQLKSIITNKAITIGDEIMIPADLDDLAHMLQRHPQATMIAGSTDVGLWVTKHMRDISPVIFIGHLEELRKIESNADGVTLGAAVSYSDAREPMLEHFPQLDTYWNRIGGEQVRNMGTIGGNIANGSPIGDTPPPFIALGASLTLRSIAGIRTIALEDYFVSYGKQDRAQDEFVEQLHLPALGANDRFGVYKISKRRDEDISALCGAFLLRLNGDLQIEMIRIVFGGMAGIPKRASAVEKQLVGKTWNEAAISDAINAFDEDYTPLSDWRASADYRMLVAKNLLWRFYHETSGNDSMTSLQAVADVS